ncbi:chemotaxis protein CheW [Helicovermis profundi]|uniref:Chemotaxis protein CheW n=1 Tax=Helicovermis profundi TaxID=3065157 RepID=A0AAU9EML4_9FIRM|nr:chemotaxis protein CheW [Clostridia bacterium S502]
MASKEYVLFKINEENYGIDIDNVENIEKIIPITRVPYTEKYVLGVVNLRGNIIPVVDLRARFSIEKKEFDDESRIIIVSVNDLKIGMVVDASSEVLRLESDDIDTAPPVRGNVHLDFVREIGKNEGRIIMLVDLKKILGLVEVEN